ncbi:MAG: TadE family protein [Acidimicrobiales bacterium]
MGRRWWSGAAGRGGRGERGSVLVEFSLVFALFVLVIYALITFGVILAAKNSLTHAAAEGARAAVAVVDDPMTPDDERVERAKEKVGQSLDWFGASYEPGDTAASVGACGTAQCITVTITYPYETRPIVPPAPGLGLVIPSDLTSTAVVELTD